ncbi:MAG: hypothetical protein ACOVLE_17195 [Pirellula staleyi]
MKSKVVYPARITSAAKTNAAGAFLGLKDRGRFPNRTQSTPISTPNGTPDYFNASMVITKIALREKD